MPADSPAKIKNILIVANSGRMLAQFAKNSGNSALVIDCFSDCDTQSLALHCIEVESLSLACVKTAFLLLKDQYTFTHAIYGSGLEVHVDTLEFLEQNLIVLGNELDVFLAIQDKLNFFSKLKQLHIPYPEVAFQAPNAIASWLLKPMQGEGGVGIKSYKDLEKDTKGCYWQKYIAGTPMSVLFVANGREAKVIGFHRLYSTQIGGDEFVFSALINQPKISDDVRRVVNSWLLALVPEFCLKGINSLDFILADQCYMLEINARPSASMQLYDDKDLLSVHINSFVTERLESVSKLKTYRAYQILFAEASFCIKQTVTWPDYVMDRPKVNTFINTNMPICSIIARGKTQQQMTDDLLFKERLVKKILQ